MDDREFEKHKKNIIITVMKQSFEDGCRSFIEEGNWKTMEELDEFIGTTYRQYLDACEEIKKYYEDKIYS